MNYKTEQDCRLLYSNIINGYSKCADGIFIKHYTEIDISHTEEMRRFFFAKAEKEGILKESDKLTLLNKNEHWTTEEEKNYKTIVEEIDSLKYSLRKLVIPQQIAHMGEMIKEKEKEIYDNFGHRNTLLGITAESYANKKASEFHIIHSFFKDKKLTIPHLDFEEIEDLGRNDINNLIDIYSKAHEDYIEKNLKKIAVCPFFLNSFMCCLDNPLYFFGKPILNLTIYQFALFNKGRYYKGILSEPEAKSPPEEYYDDLDSVIKFYDQQYGIILGKRNNSSKT